MAEIRIENLNYRYRNSARDVLKDINCNFTTGTITAIVGPSGSGKTTLMSLLAGLDKPTSGKILIDGQDLADMDLDAFRRQSIAMIFQSFQLFPFLTAVENVCYPMELNDIESFIAKRHARSLLNSVGITQEKQKRFPNNLSGGEQQRVAITRALSSGAKVLLADEPTGNLDSANGKNVIDILRQLAHEEDYCVIVVTHNNEMAASLDKVLRMVDGVLFSD